MQYFLLELVKAKAIKMRTNIAVLLLSGKLLSVYATITSLFNKA